MRFDDDYDLIIIGSGISGLAGAIAGADHGLKTVILESSEIIGGGTSLSNGGIWIPNNSIARAEGLDDSAEDAAAYLAFLGGGFEIKENAQSYLVNSPVALDYFARAGIPFKIVHGVPDHYYDGAPGSKPQGRMIETSLVSAFELGEWRVRTEKSPYVESVTSFEENVKWGGRGNLNHWPQDIISKRRAEDIRGIGAGTTVHFLKGALDRGVKILHSSRVKRLILDGDTVMGVEVRHEKVTRKFRASRGVLVASGGYESNARLVEQYETFSEWHSMFPPSLAGDGLLMSAEIGAAIRSLPINLAVFLGLRGPESSDESWSPMKLAFDILALPHSMVVNRSGQRFADEASFQDLVNALRQFDLRKHGLVNLPCFVIFDQQFANKYPFLGQPAGQPIPEWVARADSIAGLADQLGIDVQGMKETWETFNDGAKVGEDRRHRRGGAAWARSYAGDPRSQLNPNLGTIEEAPFYGARMVASGLSSAGLLTNRNAQVIHVRGHAIPKLYASGNVSAQVDFGAGYQAGQSLGRGLVFSYLAIAHMAQN